MSTEPRAIPEHNWTASKDMFQKKYIYTLGDFCLGASRIQPRANVNSGEAADGGESTWTEGGKEEGKGEGGKAEEAMVEIVLVRFIIY